MIHFTKREIEIIKHLADGLTAKEVADKLHVSPKTVDRHTSNARSKIGVVRSTGLVAYCLRKGLIT